MDLVNEEDLVGLYRRQSTREIELLLQYGSGGQIDSDVQFASDDVRQGGLAKPRRTVQQDVIERLATTSCGFNGDRQVLLELRLSNEIAQGFRSEGNFELAVVVLRLR